MEYTHDIGMKIFKMLYDLRVHFCQMKYKKTNIFLMHHINENL